MRLILLFIKEKDKDVSVLENVEFRNILSKVDIKLDNKVWLGESEMKQQNTIAVVVLTSFLAADVVFSYQVTIFVGLFSVLYSCLSIFCFILKNLRMALR